MTRTDNARAAGAAYLIYFAAGIGSMAVGSSVPGASGVLTMMMPFCAIALGVTLYALTRDVDRDLAAFAMACRVVEAAPGNGELFFATGSTVFCYLLLRGRLIPVALAWLGFAASAFLVILLLAQAGGLFGGHTNWSSPVTWFVWLPLLVFELAFAGILLTKGVAATGKTA